MFSRKRFTRVRASRFLFCALVCTTLYVAFVLIPIQLSTGQPTHHKQSIRSITPLFVVSRILRVMGLDGQHHQHKHHVDVLLDNRTEDSSKKNTHFLTVHLQARLGNRMFAYASLLGIAHKNHMIPCLSDDDEPLREIFKVTTVTCPGNPTDEWPKFQDSRSATFDVQSQRLNYATNIQLLGYFQSWKYFEQIRNRIRLEFAFDDWTIETSKIFMNQAIRRHFADSANLKDVIAIGVHVRVGDMTSDINRERGYRIADVAYLKKAMSHFRSTHRLSKLIFIVCSDNIHWAQQHISHDLAPVIFSYFDDDLQDLSILSMCDHVIMTVGTYGWWGAWLAGGNVTYVSNYATPRSSIDVLLEPRDYFYPSWIPL